MMWSIFKLRFWPKKVFYKEYISSQSQIIDNLNLLVILGFFPEIEKITPVNIKISKENY